MKKQLWKAGTFLAALLATSIAVGQSNRGEMLADIPFAFSVANHDLPPGHYTVIALNQTLLSIVSSHNQGTVVLAQSTDGVPTEATGKMVFRRYGDTYFLSEVWGPASRNGRKLFQSQAEAEISRKAKPMEIAVLRSR